MKWGILPEKIHPLGIPISEKFQICGEKEKYRERHGLKKGLLTVLVTSGSFGMGPTGELLDILNGYEGKVQAFVVCGNNKTLFDTVSKKKYAIPVSVFPFINFMDELMEASDLVVAKSGGLTMCESLAKELPMVISRPIPGQETYNADFLTSSGAAFRIKKASDVKQILNDIISDPGVLEAKKENIRKIKKPHATKDIVDLVMGMRG